MGKVEFEENLLSPLPVILVGANVEGVPEEITIIILLEIL